MPGRLERTDGRAGTVRAMVPTSRLDQRNANSPPPPSGSLDLRAQQPVGSGAVSEPVALDDLTARRPDR